MRNPLPVAALGARATLATILLACSGDVTEPPSGLPVTLTTSAAPAGARPAPSITATGDSVVAVAVLSTSGCYRYAVEAGQRSGALVLTITATETGQACLAVLMSSTFRVVAHQAPRGPYDAVLQQRTVPVSGAAAVPTELVRASVAVP